MMIDRSCIIFLFFFINSSIQPMCTLSLCYVKDTKLGSGNIYLNKKRSLPPLNFPVMDNIFECQHLLSVSYSIELLPVLIICIWCLLVILVSIIQCELLLFLF